MKRWGLKLLLVLLSAVVLFAIAAAVRWCSWPVSTLRFLDRRDLVLRDAEGPGTTEYYVVEGDFNEVVDEAVSGLESRGFTRRTIVWPAPLRMFLSAYARTRGDRPRDGARGSDALKRHPSDIWADKVAEMLDRINELAPRNGQLSDDWLLCPRFTRETRDETVDLAIVKVDGSAFVAVCARRISIRARVRFLIDRVIGRRPMLPQPPSPPQRR